MPLNIEYLSPQICRATLNRPGAKNAIDFETVTELEALVEEITGNHEVRALIFQGSGEEVFVAGGDLRKFHSIRSEEEAAEMSARIHKLFSRIESLPCWTIAYLNGDAYGGGVELMLSFDFRTARPGVKLGFTQGRFYLTPGWGGLSRLVEKTGRSTALRLQGRAEIIDLKEALRLNLIDYVTGEEEPEQDLLNWTGPLLKNDRNYIQTLKRGSRLLHDAKQKALQAEIGPFSRLWASEQHMQRVDDFLSRSKGPEQGQQKQKG